MMMKRVLITGGTGGIGRALIRVFLKKDYRVLFTYCSSDETARKLEKEGAVGYHCDFKKTEEIEKACAEIFQTEENIDVLINNAGVSSFGLFQELSNEEWNRVRAVNLDAPLFLCRAVIPGMITRKNGRIINISSMWGQVGASCEVAYSTAKAGLLGFSKALAKEVGPSGITVNCVCPGVIDTEMNACLGQKVLEELKNETPMGRLGTPEDVAGLCLWLAGENASFVTGQVLGINGGYVIT